MTPDTRPPTHPPRLIEHGEIHGEARPPIRLPEQWLRGLLAGAEALILGWLVLVVPAVAAYVATAADPALGSAGWVQAAQVGTAGWFLAHGAGLTVGDAQISVVPLGLTLVCVVLMATAVRRARLQQWTPVWVAVVTYVLLGAGLLLLDSTPGAWQGLIGAAAVGTLGALWGVRGRGLPRPAWWTNRPTWLQCAGRAAVRSTIALIAAATVLVAITIATSIDQILEVHRSLDTDVVSTVVIVFAQLLLLPVLIVWAVAFLLGPGFAVGADTLFSPQGAEAGPLPLIPVLGALPEPHSLASDLPLLTLVGVVIGLGSGWWLVRRGRGEALWQSLAAVAVLTAATVGMVALASWLASGGIGPGAMTVVGPDPLAVAGAVCWQVGGGALLAALGLHPQTWAAVRGLWQAARHRGTEPGD